MHPAGHGSRIRVTCDSTYTLWCHQLGRQVASVLLRSKQGAKTQGGVLMVCCHTSFGCSYPTVLPEAIKPYTSYLAHEMASPRRTPGLLRLASSRCLISAC